MSRRSGMSVQDSNGESFSGEDFKGLGTIQEGKEGADDKRTDRASISPTKDSNCTQAEKNNAEKAQGSESEDSVNQLQHYARGLLMVQK